MRLEKNWIFSIYAWKNHANKLKRAPNHRPEESFLAAEDSVDVDIYFKKKHSAGLFGGQGFILQILVKRNGIFANRWRGNKKRPAAWRKDTP